jgi:hypothetical protein
VYKSVIGHAGSEFFPAELAGATTALQQVLIPPRCIFRETRSLNAPYTKTLPSWSLHYHPTLEAVDDLCSQRLQTRYLCMNVICLDVDMNPTFMLHALNLHEGFIWRSLQHDVIATSSRMAGIYRAAEGLGPEIGGLINV